MPTKHDLSQRWEDKRTPTPEYAEKLMDEFGFGYWHRIGKLRNTEDIYITVGVKKRSAGTMISSPDQNICSELCPEPSKIQTVIKRLKRDSFVKAFRRFPAVRKTLWQRYLSDCKWSERKTEISQYPKQEYLNYCEFLS